MSISKHPNPWSSVLVALAAAVALAACSKRDADKDKVAADRAQATPAHTSDQAVKPHGSHDPAHGGLVMMDAAYHVEIVLDPKAGQHRVYVSDGARDALPASTFDEVKLTVAGEALAMTRAADDRSWQVTGKPAPTSGAKVSIAYSKGGKQVARFDDLPIEYVLTGKMPGGDAHDHAAAGGHAHQAPHGGLVTSTTGGHIELVADASGKFQVWLLDGQLAVRPVEGAAVKIKVAAKGYTDVAAAATGDHFEGTGAAIPGQRPAAIVTATVGGKTETARFELGAAGAAKRIAITVTEDGFEPDDIKVTRGEPVTFVFERKSDKTCAKEVIIHIDAGNQIEKKLPLNQPVEVAVTFPTSGDVTYACGMDMIKGSIHVQ